ncbi:uncharacterized protein LOC134880841 [Eleginops maclovinus]|uniref:uncharacterized protein LOC134880841 n=1 Tax=Eleginops maclovinus TaxID=56733 RepID=UPI003080BE33
MPVRLTRGRSREGKRGNPATSHPEDPFVPADADREKDMQTDEREQLSEASMVKHNHSAGPGSERLCDPDGFPPQGLDMNSGHSDTQEHTHCDSRHTSKMTRHDSGPTVSMGHGASSSLSPYTEVDLVARMMKLAQPTGIQNHSTRPTRRGEISANQLGTSGSTLSTPMQSPSPKTNPNPLSAFVSPRCRSLSACLSRPASGSGIGHALRPLSRAAQEIMDICSVDQMGCEDPDLDTDTTAHTLRDLEQELKLMANGAEQQAVVFGTRNRYSPNQHENHRFSQGRASEEQKDEEAAAQRDRQSVLLLP